MYARQAIVTKFHGPTDHKPGRVRATCEAGTYTHEWNHELGVVENHAITARTLARRLGWGDREAHIGFTRDGQYVVVFVDVSAGASGDTTQVCGGAR